MRHASKFELFIYFTLIRGHSKRVDQYTLSITTHILCRMKIQAKNILLKKLVI